jgi:hypothetical protein
MKKLQSGKRIENQLEGGRKIHEEGQIKNPPINDTRNCLDSSKIVLLR